MNDYQNKINTDYIYGIHPVIEAVNSGKVIERLYVQQDLRNPQIKELLSITKQMDIPVILVPGAKLNRITRKNHQGVICYLSPVEYHDLKNVVQSAFESGEDPLVVMLDRVTDVRNFGSICRTAECMGAHAVLVPQRGGAMVNSDAIKASSGAINRMPICREHNLKNSLSYLKDSGLTIISCTEKSSKNSFDIDLTGPLVLIMGSEQDGVSQEYIKLSEHSLKIPMEGDIASLNVSVATGMFLYEIQRQRLQNKN